MPNFLPRVASLRVCTCAAKDAIDDHEQQTRRNNQYQHGQCWDQEKNTRQEIKPSEALLSHHLSVVGVLVERRPWQPCGLRPNEELLCGLKGQRLDGPPDVRVFQTTLGPLFRPRAAHLNPVAVHLAIDGDIQHLLQDESQEAHGQDPRDVASWLKSGTKKL